MKRLGLIAAAILSLSLPLAGDVVKVPPASIASGSSPVAGCTGRVVYGNASSVLECESGFTYDSSTNVFVTPGYTQVGGPLLVRTGDLNSGTMTYETVSQSRALVHAFTWTNAQIVALGAVSAGDISAAILPAKEVLRNAYVVILTPDTSANALTVACGRSAVAYIDYIVASDAKASANTVYGDATAERGTNLTGYDMPSYTGTTTVNCHFIKTTTNLNTVTGSTGRVILVTERMP